MLNSIYKLLLSLGLYGLMLFFLGVHGWLNAWSVGLPGFMVILQIVRYINQYRQSIISLISREKVILGLILAQLIVNGFGVFVPETGFDAVWYHLPEAQVYATTGSIQKIPELIYSTMPRLAEMFFIPAVLFFTPKLVSFFFLFLFLALTYHLARDYLTRAQSLIIVLIVNSVYVITWLSTSGYIDITRAVFELASFSALLPLFRGNRRSSRSAITLSAVFAGFALSIKMHSFINLFILIFLLCIVLYRRRLSLKRSLLSVSLFLTVSLTVAFPWYLSNYLESGHPFYPLNLPGKQMDQLAHAGATSINSWLTTRLYRLPLLLWDFTFSPTDFLTPAFLIILPLALWRFRFLPPYVSLYSIVYLVTWWFLPPPETRYLITIMPLLAIMSLKIVTTLPPRYRLLQGSALAFIFLSVLVTFAFRVHSSRKYLPVLLGQSTPEQYLESQTTPFNRNVLTKFHSGYWLNYQYK